MSERTSVADDLVGDSERGDTLIEVLFTVVIISIAVAALMGALITAISTSGEHRGLAVDDTLLKSYAEAAKQQIEVSQTVPYVACASSYAIAYTVPAQFPNYTITQQSVAWWNGSSFTTSSPCTATTRPNKGMQLITISASAPSAAGGFTQQLSFVVRDPNYES